VASLPPWKLVCMATGAAIAPTVLSHPFDVLKTKVMEAGAAERGVTARSAVGDVLRERGPAGLFRGLTVRVATVAPLFGIALSTFDVLQRTLLPETVPGASAKERTVGSGDCGEGASRN
jgi:hypothetical protein